MKIAIVALGGNAVITPKEIGTIHQQERHVNQTVKHLKSLVRKYKIVVTHGNGPQVGDLLIQQEKGKPEVPPMPLDVCDAMTQGQLGYLIQRGLKNYLKKPAATIVTQILVDRKDPAFRKPTKPIGPYFKTMKEPNMVKEPEGWRKVVASPKPKKIIEIKEIKTLIEKGFVVIACGGGGIPVIMKKKKLDGIEAVIDKDRASEKLASQLKASLLIFLTDVPYVYLNYGLRDQKPLKKMSVVEARKYMKQGYFAPGSMKPKIEASIDFLKHGGKKVLITTPKLLDKALVGKTGTIIK